MEDDPNRNDSVKMDDPNNNNSNNDNNNNDASSSILKWADEVSVVDSLSDDDGINEENAKYLAALAWWGDGRSGDRKKNQNNNKNQQPQQQQQQQEQKRWSNLLEQMNENVQQSIIPKSKLINDRKRLGDSTKRLMKCLQTVETTVHDIRDHPDNHNNNDNNIDLIRNLQRSIDVLTIECKSTIRSYQEENDKLTKQYKKIEKSSTNIIHQLKNVVPDPTILIHRLLEQKPGIDQRTGAPLSGVSIHLTPTKNKKRKKDGTVTPFCIQGRCGICKKKTTYQCSACMEDENIAGRGFICHGKSGRMCFPDHLRIFHEE